MRLELLSDLWGERVYEGAGLIPRPVQGKAGILAFTAAEVRAVHLIADQQLQLWRKGPRDFNQLFFERLGN